MEAESFQIFAVQYNPESIERYRETLFNDDEIEDLPCTFKATTATGLSVASNMVFIYNNYMANFLTGEDIREIPFKFEFNAPMMFYEFTK
jgi:hypothetical protein